MPKLIVSIDDVVIKEVQITKEKTTIGRRPYNDLVIDNLAVSGEHALVQMQGEEVSIEDLNSTNGTYINGKGVKRQALHSGDVIEIGKYRVKFLAEAAVPNFDKTMVVKARPALAVGATPPAAPAPMPAPVPPQPAPMPAAAAPAAHAAAAEMQASIKVLSGAAAGREVPLVKVVTTIGKPGVAVAAITRRQHGYVVHQVEGAGNPSLNGAPIGKDPVPLTGGDVIELAGTRMQFLQH